MKKNNILFILVFAFLLLIGDYALVRQQKNISITENRTLQHFDHITLKNFIDGSYQNSLENALSDQFVGGEFIKKNFKDSMKILHYKKIPSYICKNNYVELNGYYSFNCDDHLISKYENVDDEIKTNILNRLKVYSKINNYIDTYYFFISSDSIYDFKNNKYIFDTIKFINDNMTGDYNLSSLTFDNYNEFEKLFYKTDHHWNYYGSYLGYIKIIDMIYPDDEVLKPEKKVTFDDIYFYGSAARNTQIFDFKEKFTVYKFNYPEHTILKDKVADSYGSEDEYYNGIYYREKLAGHYGNFYGGDNGEVIFDFNNPDKDNLLLIGSSFTNAINKLVASHFNKTYVIDLRHYSELTNEEFDIKEYVNNNNIDKVLFIMNYGFLKDQSFNMKWED